MKYTVNGIEFESCTLNINGEIVEGIKITSGDEISIASTANVDFPTTEAEAIAVYNDPYTVSDSEYYYNSESNVYEA